MHLRPPATTTLGDLDVQWRSHDRTWTSDACVPTVDFATPGYTAPVLSLGDHVIALDERAIEQLCAFYGIPNAYFKRITPAEQHFVMNARIDHAAGEVTVAYNATGVTDVRKPSQPRLEPEDFVRLAHRLYPAAATVPDAWVTADDLRLDVLDTATTLDGGLRGGLRFSQNRKQNLAPTVAPILYHEPTTTTIEIPDPSLRIDVRGVAVDKITERLAAEALRAEARLVTDAGHLLALENTGIAADRIARLQRIADEYGLPVRPLAEITARVAATEDPTLFDLALAIANTANTPKLAEQRKHGVRARLQRIAGHIVTEHAQRCSACYALVAA